jgi:hypothetical protein
MIWNWTVNDFRPVASNLDHDTDYPGIGYIGIACPNRHRPLPLPSQIITQRNLITERKRKLQIYEVDLIRDLHGGDYEDSSGM